MARRRKINYAIAIFWLLHIPVVAWLYFLWAPDAFEHRMILYLTVISIWSLIEPHIAADLMSDGD